MKIERINENQIRIILSKDDLLNRKIKLNELTYGSEKAKNLFYDMMLQANIQFGFESNGVPLMIEAIPSVNSLILNITRVSDPEELDPRFSSFSSSPNGSSNETRLSGADSILNLLKRFKSIQEGRGEGSLKNTETHVSSTLKDAVSEQQPAELIEAFRFSSLDDAIKASKAVNAGSAFQNSLFKFDDSYLLFIHSGGQDPERFNRICNVLSEYSISDHCSDTVEAYLKEHGHVMIADFALQKLARL